MSEKNNLCVKKIPEIMIDKNFYIKIVKKNIDMFIFASYISTETYNL